MQANQQKKWEYEEGADHIYYYGQKMKYVKVPDGQRLYESVTPEEPEQYDLPFTD